MGAKKKMDSKVGVATVLLSILLGALTVLFSDFANSRVPFVRECTGKDPGAWEWGEAADGCDASRFGSLSRIKYIYGEFVFDRTKSGDEDQRKTYLTNVHALLREISSQYIRSRRPDVQDDEVRAFVEAVLAAAHQETFWSHYRIGKQGGLKLTTGDRNISHGMMQINQRYHASREQDRSFDLVGNVSFGVEHLYDEWESGLKAKCIQRAKNQTREQTLQNVTRAAYSAYNGGSGAICRWTNPRHPWAKNDRNYFKKLTEREWSPFIRDANLKLKIDLACARSGDELCAVAKERMGEYITSRPLVMEDGSTCVTTDGKSLHCAQDLRVFTCLAGLSPDVMANPPLKVKASDKTISSLPKKTYENRIELCQAAYRDLVTVGEFVVATEDKVPVKSDVDGKVVGTVKKGQMFQVLDFDVDLGDGSGSAPDRYYRVRLANKVDGWVSGSAMAKSGTPAGGSHLGSVNSWLPKVGGILEIAKHDGTKLLVAPGDKSEIKAQLAKGQQVQVEDLEIRGAANEIWARVRTGRDVGYIYAGRTYPDLSIDQWVKVK